MFAELRRRLEFLSSCTIRRVQSTPGLEHAYLPVLLTSDLSRGVRTWLTCHSALLSLLAIPALAGPNPTLQPR